MSSDPNVDRAQYPDRYVMGTGKGQNSSPAAQYLSEWHSKGYTGNYVPEDLRKSEAPEKAESEVVVDPVTGGKKGRKDEELAFVDPLALLALARVAGKGGRKYEKYNYLRGFDYSLSANALLRHFLAFWSGEDYDPDSGELHMAAAAWHALSLVSFTLREIGNDDRPAVQLVEEANE